LIESSEFRAFNLKSSWIETGEFEELILSSLIETSEFREFNLKSSWIESSEFREFNLKSSWIETSELDNCQTPERF
jgi:hypothetical protein